MGKQKLILAGAVSVAVAAALFSSAASASLNYSFSSGYHDSSYSDSSNSSDRYSGKDESTGAMFGDLKVTVSAWSDTGSYGKLQEQSNGFHT